MMAHHHVAGGLALATPLVLLVPVAAAQHMVPVAAQSAAFVERWALMDHLWWFSGLAVVMFFLGTLLPDIDHSRSALGRYVAVSDDLRGPHRGFTHTDFFWMSLLGLSFVPGLRVLFWLALGTWTHDVLDQYSRAGRVRFYPFQTYSVRTLRGGTRCVVRRDGWKGWYRAGQRSEVIFFRIVMFWGVIASLSLVALLLHLKGIY